MTSPSEPVIGSLKMRWFTRLESEKPIKKWMGTNQEMSGKWPHVIDQWLAYWNGVIYTTKNWSTNKRMNGEWPHWVG